MTTLGELHGTVTVRVDGIDGEGVATFTVPIAVLSETPLGVAHAVAVGTPPDTIRDAVATAAASAFDIVDANIPDAIIEHAHTP